MKGKSGNPSGRPKGSRNRIAAALDGLISENVGEVLTVVLDRALDGDLNACRMLLDRAWPAPKDRALSIDLPDTCTPEGIDDAQGAIVAAVARGSLLPSEGATLTALVEARRKSIETNELAERLAEVENRLGRSHGK